MRVFLYSVAERRTNMPRFSQQVVASERTGDDFHIGRCNVRRAYRAMRRGGMSTQDARVHVWALTNNGITLVNVIQGRRG